MNRSTWKGSLIKVWILLSIGLCVVGGALENRVLMGIGILPFILLAGHMTWSYIFYDD